MREIKFRAWDPIEEMMTTSFLINANGDVDWNEGYIAPELKVMQFTGLKDKNGKEIYEGDIVTTGDYEFEKQQIVDTNTAGVIKYFGADNYPAFDFEGNDMETNLLSYLANDGQMEVIGNIYENPDLLN